MNKELEKILADHKKWLNNEPGGVRANFRGQDFRGIDFNYADFTGANFTGAICIGADFSHADFTDASFDFSYLPLRCGFLKEAHFDERTIIQILYHTLFATIHSKNVSEEFKELLLTDANLEIANRFHRTDCERLTKGV